MYNKQQKSYNPFHWNKIPVTKIAPSKTSDFVYKTLHCFITFI